MIFHRDHVREPLYCIVPVFNPWRWKSRIKHTERALKHFHDSGATIVLVEIGFNRREFSFADSGLDGTLSTCAIHGEGLKHKYIGLHTKDELWLKENAINIKSLNIKLLLYARIDDLSFQKFSISDYDVVNNIGNYI